MFRGTHHLLEIPILSRQLEKSVIIGYENEVSFNISYSSVFVLLHGSIMAGSILIR